jgi:hypothetical protein
MYFIVYHMYTAVIFVVEIDVLQQKGAVIVISSHLKATLTFNGEVDTLKQKEKLNAVH